MVTQQTECRGIDTSLLDSDVGNWTVTVTESLRIYIVKRGPEYFQNHLRECSFESVQRTATNLKGLNRQLTTNCFYKQLVEWRQTFKKMDIILHQRKVCCKLFYTGGKPADTSKFITGFWNWRKLNPKVYLHENSYQHLSNLVKWKILGSRLVGHAERTEHMGTNEIVHQGYSYKELYIYP